MRLKAAPIAIIIAFSFAISCANKQVVLEQSGSKGDQLFVKGKTYYEKEKWGKAIKFLKEFTYSFPYHDSIAQGTYLLADSYYRDGQYSLAVNEFRRVAYRFSKTDYAERAELMMAEAMLESAPSIALEQEQTERALEAFRDFVTYHPTSEYLKQAEDGIQRCRERLAEKEYRAAELYLKLDKPDAAILYADLIADEYAGTSWVPRAMLIKARALAEELDQTDAAIRVLAEIVEKYPESKVSDEAERYIGKFSSN